MKNSMKYISGTEKNTLKQFVGLMRATLGKNLIRIELFGSRARGDYSKGSDIDILIIVKERTIDVMDKIAEITAELNLEYNLSISPVVFSEYEYKVNTDMASPFSLAVESEGVRL
ncbi:MAG: nucleotidyltransferase domain-containing protein [Thermodesulfovibrionales bacterium]|nr:nucleotidyltransferase domain-containing protein [Thermodesulfovibrionales bacterium]MDP3049597.1 nucleotidyltransferase domain-containing protein [Thermodesulfovibrionales bacterium]